MKILCRAGVLAILFLVSATAFAQLRYEFVRTYYDGSGTEVGYYWYNCNGGNGSQGTTTEIYAVTYTDVCAVAEPFSCNGEGLTTIGSCEVSQWCVSSGYYYSYTSHVAKDCAGNCYQGWCYTKSGSRRYRPSLTAALNAKLWEVLAVMRK